MPNQMLIANLYNPHEQSKQELIDSFVVRLKIFHKLFSEIRNSDMKHPEQHFLIEAQRGMGKTTLLLRLSYEIENDVELNTWLIPIVFKEESYYGITRLFKLWEETARLLEAGEPKFAGLFNQMEAQYDENKDYERLCFEILTNALKQHHKKLILFIDNLSELFKNFNDMECHRLREILMNCPEMRIIGATAGTLEASFRYEHAFYEFFKKAPLPGLDKEETYSLLRELAKTYQKTAVMDNIMAHQPGRIESLRILTGGVIRTMVLLFEIFTDHENGNSVSDLEKILDRVTPLYKHRMDDLAPMQRDVVHAMALSWDAVSSEELAKKTRMPSDKVAEIFAQLEKFAMIQRTATDTQMNFYYLQERFFNIWYLMRLAPKGSHSRVIWLVRFLESWYDEAGLVERARQHIEVLSKGDYYPKAALYITEALARTGKLDMELEHELICETREFLYEKDKSLLEDLSLTDKEVWKIYNKYYRDNDYAVCLNLLNIVKNKDEVYFYFGIVYQKLKDNANAEKYYLLAVEKGDVKAMNGLGILYQEFKDNAKAEKYYLMAVEKGYGIAMYNLALLYENEFNDNFKAEKYYLMAVEKGYGIAMNNLGNLYHTKLKDYSKAEKYYLMGVQKQHILAAYNLGNLYRNELKNYILAEKYYRIALQKKHVSAMLNLGCMYHLELKDYTKAKKYYLMAINKGSEDAMNNLGVLYEGKFKDIAKAEKYYLMAIEKGHDGAIFNCGVLYKNKYKDNEKAEKYYLMGVEKGDIKAMNNLGGLYYNEFNDKEKAEKYYLMAAEKGFDTAMTNLGGLYYNEFNDKEKAEKYFLMAVEKCDVKAMTNLGVLYEKDKDNVKEAEKYYLMAVERGYNMAMFYLGLLYKDKYKDNEKAEKYFLMAVKNGHKKAMNNLAIMYFRQKVKKQKALEYARQSVENNKNYKSLYVLSLIYAWDNQFDNAVQIAIEFIYSEQSYETYNNDIIIYIYLLLAKEQYHYVTEYFEDPELNLKDRFKPLYYALLYFKNDPDYHKMPPELAEPVKDIIEKVKQMAVDYA